MTNQLRADLLHTPVLGRMLLWKHSRTVFQAALFALAGMMVLDGLFGTPLAAKNTATVGAWVHYRGLIVIALLVVGNLFCAGCPFIFTRKLAKWIGRPQQRWPKRLRNKWLAIAAFVSMLFAYELFDLWASPWLTAWVILGYFVVAFVLEALFTNNSFCLYVCPLGTFNFLYSSVSPTQITNRQASVCRECAGKECINGRRNADDRLIQQGCQLELYVPTIKSNMDCTLCLDCAKACPYDNVALAVRPWGSELLNRTWPRRLDLALLALIVAFTGLMNAFAMTPPAYALERTLAGLLQTKREAYVLGLLFAVGAVILPLTLVYAAAWINRVSVGVGGSRLRDYVVRYAVCFAPVGFGVWAGHYLFHLLVGPLTIAPAVQRFVADFTGAALLGEENWVIGGMLTPTLGVVRTVQVAAVVVGAAFAIVVGWRSASTQGDSRRQAALELAPWLIIILALAIAAIVVFLLPMEMRGNVLG